MFAGYRNSPPDQARWFGIANVIAVPCDVTDPDQVLAAASTIGAHTGGTLDLLINNARYSSREGVIEADIRGKQFVGYYDTEVLARNVDEESATTGRRSRTGCRTSSGRLVLTRLCEL